MLNPAHLLEVALLLLAAFLVGAVVGTLMRVLAERFRRPAAAKPAPAATAAPAEDPFPVPALVAAPVIDPLPQPAKPTDPVVLPPEEVPVPDFAAALLELARESPPAALPDAPSAAARNLEPMPEIRPIPPIRPLTQAVGERVDIRPSRTAGEATSGRHVGALRAPVETAAPAGAEVVPFPSAAAPAQPAVPERPADPEIAWDAVLLGRAEPAVAAVPPAAIEIAPVPPVVVPEPDTFIEAPAAAIAAELAAVAESPPKAVLPQADAPAPAMPPTDQLDMPVPELAVEMEPAAAPAVAAAEVTDLPPATPPLPSERPVPIAVVSPPAAGESVLDPLPEPVVPPELATTPEPAPVPVSPPVPVPPVGVDDTDEDREAAAMRAIEGSWTPGRIVSRPTRALDPPEGVSDAVSASGAAVAAAARAVEAVVAESTASTPVVEEVDLVAALSAALAPDVADAATPEPLPEPGRPVGLDAPRQGEKDDLTHVIGILPAIETALNDLGLYHFDQLATLDDDNVGWLEAHLAAPGRIRRELWREQARELEAALRPRAATGS